LVGYSREELIGKNQTTLHPPEDLEFIIAKFKEFTSTEGYKEINTYVLHQNGNRVPVKISASNNFEEDGIMYAAAYFKDITSEESLEKIAYIQSHIVRAPIVNILGLLEVFDIQKFEGTEEQKTILLTIQDLTLELDNIVKDIVKKTY
jgi:PAS domain-containing protein